MSRPVQSRGRARGATGREDARRVGVPGPSSAPAPGPVPRPVPAPVPGPVRRVSTF